jgi:hypothetical protein
MLTLLAWLVIIACIIAAFAVHPVAATVIVLVVWAIARVTAKG